MTTLHLSALKAVAEAAETALGFYDGNEKDNALYTIDCDIRVALRKLDALGPADTDDGWSEAQLRAIIQTYEKSANRIQGFLYGERLVIRDVWKPYDQQNIWTGAASDYTDEQFIEQCRIERLRISLPAPPQRAQEGAPT